MGVFAVLMTDRGRRLGQDHLAGIIDPVDPDPTPYFRIRVDTAGAPAAPSDGPGAAPEDASRAGQHYNLAWERGPAIVAGDRLEVEARGVPGVVTYEVSAVPEAHRGLSGVLATTAEAIRLTDLYPLTATVEELGGTAVATGVPVGVWRASDGINQASGVQYDYDAIVPWEHRDEVDASDHPNRQLRIAGHVYRIVGSSPRERVPRVVLRLRRMRPGG